MNWLKQHNLLFLIISTDRSSQQNHFVTIWSLVTFGQPQASQLMEKVFCLHSMVTRILYINTVQQPTCKQRHFEVLKKNVDQDAEQSKMCVNDVAIVNYYQRYICHDNFVKMPPKCPTNRLCCFKIKHRGICI